MKRILLALSLSVFMLLLVACGSTHVSNGRIVTETTYDASGKETTKVTKTYDKDGLLLEIVSGESKIVYTYKDGLLVTFTGGNDKIEYIYNEQKLLISSKYFNFDNLIKESTFTYNDQNLRKTKIDIDGQGNLISNSEFAYDENKNLVEVATMANDGILRVTRNTYDADNNLVKAEYYSNNELTSESTYVYENKLLVKNINKYAESNTGDSVVYIYDKENRVVEQQYFVGNQTIAVSIIKFTYTEK